MNGLCPWGYQPPMVHSFFAPFGRASARCTQALQECLCPPFAALLPQHCRCYRVSAPLYSIGIQTWDMLTLSSTPGFASFGWGYRNHLGGHARPQHCSHHRALMLLLECAHGCRHPCSMRLQCSTRLCCVRRDRNRRTQGQGQLQKRISQETD